MTTIPLFPLRMVLFPKIPLRLKVFEPRYQELLGDCIKDRMPFGIVLIKQGLEVGDGPVVTHMTGVTAQITRIDPQDKGVSFVTAIGDKRFNIHSFNHDHPYLAGDVEFNPLHFNQQTTEYFPFQSLQQDIHLHLQQLHQRSRQKTPFKQPSLPPNLEILSYLAASVLQIPPQEKQALLELESDSAFLEEIHRLVRREIAVLKYMKPGMIKKGFERRN